MRRLCSALLPLLVLACSSPDEPTDPPGKVPDALSALVVHPAQFLEEQTPLRMLSDGDPFDLWSAIQGGHVALVGAQIEGVGGDTIDLRARFTDLATGLIIAEEARTVVVVPVPGSATLKQPNLRLRSQVTHVPLCPDYEPYDMIGREVLLTVTVTELYTSPPRKGVASVRVTPRCGDLVEDVGLCQCECSANYTLGKCK